MPPASSFPLFLAQKKKMLSPSENRIEGEPLHDAVMGQDEDLVMAAAASPGMKYGSVEPAKNGELAPRESQSSGGT